MHSQSPCWCDLIQFHDKWWAISMIHMTTRLTYCTLHSLMTIYWWLVDVNFVSHYDDSAFCLWYGSHREYNAMKSFCTKTLISLCCFHMLPGVWLSSHTQTQGIFCNEIISCTKTIAKRWVLIQQYSQPVFCCIKKGATRTAPLNFFL